MHSSDSSYEELVTIPQANSLNERSPTVTPRDPLDELKTDSREMDSDGSGSPERGESGAAASRQATPASPT